SQSMVASLLPFLLCPLFFVNDTPSPSFYSLSLHDALPISPRGLRRYRALCRAPPQNRHPSARVRAAKSSSIWRSQDQKLAAPIKDRKSTRLNSSHVKISYAVFCLKKKKKTTQKSLFLLLPL